ncbi:MAG: hypothetical protein WA117_10920 [Verrucomicrobiia bacterium]
MRKETERRTKRLIAWSTLRPLSGVRAATVFIAVSLFLAASLHGLCQMGILPVTDPLSATAATAKRPSVFYANPGPWGKLRCFYIFLEAPMEMVETFPLPSSKPRWSFPESELPKLPDLFKSAGLPDKFVAALLDPRNCAAEDGLLHLFPSVADVEAMTPMMRDVIYPQLAKCPANEFYCHPVRILTDTADEWFQSANLRPELIARIRQLSYRKLNCLVFSDLAVMMNHATSDSEARRIYKACTRTRSLMVQMELDDKTKLEPLLDYWTLGIGIRRKDIEPIMQAIINTDGVDRLGLSHVLPALARKLLYTYPGPEFSRHGILPDCHWTSLNFFNYEPHEYLLDSRLATNLVLEKFETVKPPYRYGDILFFMDGGAAFHSCVYLADDMVFTKNGRNALSPWVIMKIPEVQKIYIYNNTTHIQGYRHKKIITDS